MLTVRTARSEEAQQLADLAAATFPLACPPDLSADDIESFIASRLSTERFAHLIASPETVVVVANRAKHLVGYALLDLSEPPTAIRALLRPGRAVEINKFFLAPSEHGRGTADALMQSIQRHAQKVEAVWAWLGVSRENRRANRFYAKHGFQLIGTQPFTVGSRTFPDDYVLARALRRAATHA